MGEVSTPTDRATMSRGLAFLFGAGASLVGVSLLLPHSRNTNGVAVALGLNNDFPTPNRIGIKGHRVNTSIATSASHFYLPSVLRKFFFKNLSYEEFKVFPANRRQVSPLVHIIGNINRLNKACILAIDPHHWRDCRHAMKL